MTANGRLTVEGASSWVWRRCQSPNGHVRYRLVEAETNMRLPDGLDRPVLFLGCRIKGKAVRGGTAFLVLLDDDPVDVGAVVTARHCIDQVERYSDDGKVLLWFNRREPGPDGAMVSAVESPVDKWVTHPTDKTIDVAVLPSLPPMREFDHGAIPLSMFATDDFVELHKIGVGDDLVIPGLFAQHTGRERSIPVIRTGQIAAMDEERVNTELGMMRAYLAEVRSIGGLSGSPVYFRNQMFRVVQGDDSVPRIGPDNSWALLGLMHGHFDMEVPPGLFDYGVRREVVNTGIGAVVPAQDIYNLLDESKEIDDVRKKTDQTPATPDFVKTDRAEAPVEPDEFEEFSDLARKIVSVPKSEIDAEREKGK